ncbi:contactin-1-like [Pecten maximus]|uniref:contactin-1-like n=1 Tax=Pecten maximus TaxID=6579 RepID=UPI001458C7AE|nr:contactin-1-like [Pecten maximus]XP_033758962.1 contactin-1-like [Pecten maximus]
MTRQILACYASNTDVQILATQRPVLNVRHRPEISIFPADDPYVVTEGQTNVTLRCVVTSANPFVTSLGWKKADTTVANIGVFKFPAITAEHAGVYTCSAFNGVGIASTISVTLTILTSPTSPNIVGFTEVTSSTLTVEWTPNAQGDMASVFNITHGCRGCAMIESSSVNLTEKGIYSSTLTNLVPQSQYYVNITAINMAGPSSPLELIVSTPADTCRFPLEVTSPSSTALLVVGVILITISVAVLGISIFVYRKSSSFSRSKNRKENPPKPVTFSNVQQSTEDTQQESVNERADYQELDPSDINRPSPYECLPEGKGEGTENIRDHYESVKVHTTHDYLKLVHDKDSSQYANT